MTFNADKCVKPAEVVPKDDKPIAIVVGAIAIGSVSEALFQMAPRYFWLAPGVDTWYCMRTID